MSGVNLVSLEMEAAYERRRLGDIRREEERRERELAFEQEMQDRRDEERRARDAAWDRRRAQHEQHQYEIDIAQADHYGRLADSWGAMK